MFVSRLTTLLIGLVFVVGCHSEPAAEQKASKQPAPVDSLPPSRAQKALPAQDYPALLTKVLQRVVNPEGLVHYDRLRAEQGENFHRVIRSIENIEAGTLNTQQEKLSFWLNAYNVLMLKNILNHPEVVDIQKDGFTETFFETPLRVAGRGLTLDQIEHGILRRESDSTSLRLLQVDSLDPRIHAALNCAARGCPRLRLRAFTPQNVDEELDRAMREFVNSPDHFRVKENGQITMSSIVEWFGPDFEQNGQAAGDYLRTYLSPEHPHYEQLNAFLKERTARDIYNSERVQFQYDWLVNRVEV